MTRAFGLRAALILLVLIAIAPVFAVVVQASLSEQRGRLDRAQAGLVSAVELSAAHQERLVEGARQMLAAIANSPPVYEDDPDACISYMRKLQTQYPVSYGTFGLLDETGHLTCRATPPETVVNSSDRLFFRTAVQTRRFSVGEFTISRASGRPVLTFGLPVYREGGDLRGVLYVALDVAQADAYLRKLTVPTDITLMVVDAQGVVLASAGARPVGVGTPLPEGALRNSIVQGVAQSFLRAKEADGAEWLYAVQSVGRPGEAKLFVASSASSHDILAPSTSRLQLQLAALAMITLFAATAAWAFGDRVVARPISRLIERVDQMEQEESVGDTPPPQGGLRELNELEERFHAMVRRLAGRAREMRDSELRYRTLFETNPHPMWVFDTGTLRFLTVNDAAVAHYGYSREEFKGMTIADIRPEDDRPVLQHALSRDLAERLSAPAVWRHRRKDGSLIDVEVSGHSLEYGGRPARMVLALDVTARLQAEEAMRQLNETLEHRVQERTEALRIANKELESFSYSVSHDLRAPLQVIDGFGRQLQARHAEQLDAKGLHYLERIRDNTAQMSVLIDDLLSLARVTRADMHVERVDLSERAAQVVEKLRQRDPGREVEVLIDPGMECEGDPRLLSIVLDNLIGNAWKFTAKAAGARIHVGMQRQESADVLSVSDNGAGFDMAYADKLFKAFQRLHTAAEFDGTGIGLATVNRIVARHGGRVWAQASPGEGASFQFSLPRSTAHSFEDALPSRL